MFYINQQIQVAIGKADSNRTSDVVFNSPKMKGNFAMKEKFEIADPYRKLFAMCALEVQEEYQMGGLAGDLYEEFAWDTMQKYLTRKIQLVESANTAETAKNNKSSPKFPKYRTVEMEFDRWRDINNHKDRTVSEKNLHKFYDIIVRNFGR